MSITDDNLFETDEQLRVLLSDVVDDRVTVSPTSADITIIDEDSEQLEPVAPSPVNMHIHV